jgi:hypothetical protein
MGSPEGNNVVPIRPQTAPMVSKKALAAHLGRSTRWVELRTAEGMPSIPPSKRFSTRRYNLAQVETWLAGDRGKPPASSVERIAALERAVTEQQARIEALERRQSS